jgi:hypothetical protein
MIMRNTSVPNIVPTDLVMHEVYFMVVFFDHDLLVPEVDALVYLGKDIFEEGDELHYFEDYEQHTEKKAIVGKPDPASERQVVVVDNRLNNIFTAAGVSQIFLDVSSRM